MPAKRNFEPGQTVGNYRVIGPAETKNNHARWSVECLACGKIADLRGTALTAGATCMCGVKPTPPAPADVTAPLATFPPNWTEMLSAAVADACRGFSDQLAAALVELRSINAEMVAARASVTLAKAEEKTAGLKDYKLEPVGVKNYKIADIRAEFPDLSAIKALEASMKRAMEIASKPAHLRLREEKEELAARTRLESREMDTDRIMDPARYAERLSFYQLVSKKQNETG